MTRTLQSVNTLLAISVFGIVLKDSISFASSLRRAALYALHLPRQQVFLFVSILKKLGFIASTKEERIIRICILGAIPFFILIHIKRNTP